MLELSTTFRNISTSGGRCSADATQAAIAHLRYIDRESAVEDRASSGLPRTSPEAQKAELRRLFRKRSKTGGANGARVAEKIIVSLPNSWPREARKEALERLCVYFAPPGSEAASYGTTHRDKAHNQHLHIIAQDGCESREAALARRSNAPNQTKKKRSRIRRQHVLRLGERQRAKQVRSEIAAILNSIAKQRDLEGVEHRSFAERGISDPAMIHEGAKVRAVHAKTGEDPTGRISANRSIRTTRELFLLGTTAIFQPAAELFADILPPHVKALTQPHLSRTSRRKKKAKLAFHR
ncbi:MobA/MobL family protein [Sulfitobacter sp. 1A13496]|uniref:MobA/MobL family protein n=1 Tax=Sulfitobacter sp. 1A13496 TaxID=3368596 RepID=UPI0037472712